jgi:hypothetical protein
MGHPHPGPLKAREQMHRILGWRVRNGNIAGALLATVLIPNRQIDAVGVLSEADDRYMISKG